MLPKCKDVSCYEAVLPRTAFFSFTPSQNFSSSNYAFLNRPETVFGSEEVRCDCWCVCVQNKCDQYWPSRGTETYGVMQVSVLDTVELAAYCVRTFALFKVNTNTHTHTCIIISIVWFLIDVLDVCVLCALSSVAAARSGRSVSSSSRPGLIMVYLNTLLRFWPSCAESKPVILQTPGLS